MSAHAKLGPSGADRWMTCTASVELLDELSRTGVIAEDRTSVYAAEGTVAHEVRELCLDLGLDPFEFVGLTFNADGMDFEITDEMADHLVTGLDWVREQSDDFDVEIRVNLDRWLPGQFGTMDTGWINPSQSVLGVSDHKYGAGVPVDAENNRQMRLYALGFWDFKGQPKVENVLMNIDQPRAGGMKFWEIPLSDLLAFGDEVSEVYAAIQSGNTNFEPSEKACKWCLAREPNIPKGYTGCPAYNQQMTDLFCGQFDDIDDEPSFPDPDELTPARRWYIVSHSKTAGKWLASLHQASLDAAIAGVPDPGSKAVIGQRGNRCFTDPEKVEGLLTRAIGTQAFKPRQLIGITDVEKFIKPGKRKPGHPKTWDALQPLIDQSDGKPMLVSADDARPAIQPLVDMFDDL